MTIRSEIATTRFLSGYNCAQAVLEAFRDEAGVDEDLALKITTGLGAGSGTSAVRPKSSNLLRSRHRT